MLILRVLVCLLLSCSCYPFANQSNAIKVDVLGTFGHLYEAMGPVTAIELSSNQFQDDKKTILVDEHGNILEHTVLHFNRQLKERTIFHYNEHGQLVEKSYRDFATANWRGFDRADDEIDSRITYFYDANGMLELEESYSEATELTLETRYRYKDKLLIEEIKYGFQGEQQARYVYSYDALGNKTEMRMYNAWDELGLRYSYKYNTDGKLIERWSHPPSGEPLLMYRHNISDEAVCSYRYDAYQNWIERSCGAVTLFRIISYRE